MDKGQKSGTGSETVVLMHCHLFHPLVTLETMIELLSRIF